MKADEYTLCQDTPSVLAKFSFTPFQNIIGGRQPTGGVWWGTNLYRSIILIGESYIDKIICFSNTLN